MKKGVLKNFTKFTGKHLCHSRFFNKKGTMAQVFPCEFCEISKKTFLTKHLWATASVSLMNSSENSLCKTGVKYHILPEEKYCSKSGFSLIFGKDTDDVRVTLDCMDKLRPSFVNS